MNDDHRPLKNALGRFATGVAVAACPRAAGGFAAITINSFASVSLEPPLVLWCVETKASSYADFMAADAYSISVLDEAGAALSARFASRDPEPLEPSEFEIARTGAPLLKGRLAGLDCRIVARHKAGDHVILVGEVVAFDSRDGDPLVYYASAYTKIERRG